VDAVILTLIAVALLVAVLVMRMNHLARRAQRERYQQQALLVQEARRSRDIQAQGERERAIVHEVLNNMREAVAVLDRDWRFTSVNPAFERMTGHALTDVLGEHCRLLDARNGDSSLSHQLEHALHARG